MKGLLAGALRPRILACSPENRIARHMFRHLGCSGPLPPWKHKRFPLRWQWYVLAAPVDAAAFTILRSGHLPDPPFDGLPGHPDIPHLAHSCNESYRLWRHSDLTLPQLKFPAAIFPGYKMSKDC
jgi:hypothetical protein